MFRMTLLPLWVFVSLSTTAMSREALWQWRAPEAESRVSPLHGNAIARAGDVDGDGIVDFLVATGGFGRFEGMVQVTSGATGETLHVLSEAEDSAIETTRFGMQVGGVGDLDGDGHDDFFISEPDFVRGKQRLGRVTVYSGQDGSVIRVHSASERRTEFGVAAASAGDVNEDGVQDLLVGEPGWNEARGRIHVLSGSTGETLAIHSGSLEGARMGTAVSGIGDVDHDGADDYVYSTRFFLPLTGQVIARSGRTGELLHQRTGARRARLGERLAAAGDVSGDGTPDYLVFRSSESKHVVEVVSGVDGASLAVFPGSRDDGFGASFCSGDVTGDGVSDVVIGSPYWSGAKKCSGRVQVFSGSEIRQGLGARAVLEFPGKMPFSRRGAQVAVAGNLDADHHAELLVADRGRRHRDAVVSLVPGSQGIPLSDRQAFDSTTATLSAAGDPPCEDVSGTLLVPEEYPTIQAAIDCAAPGSTIVLAPGVYTGPGNRDIDYGSKAIRVTSAEGPLDCLINAEFDSQAFVFDSGEGPDSILDGVTVLRGLGDLGGGIQVAGASPTIRRCVFVSNIAFTDGGAFYAGLSDVRMDRCFFQNNIALNRGGAIAVSQSRLRLLNSLLIENKALLGDGGALHCSADNGSVVKFCTFARNQATLLFGAGAAIASLSRSIIVRNSVLWGNVSWFNDEIQMARNGSVQFCVVDGGWPGTAILDEDPRFVDPDNLDYHLQAMSPCVDAGGSGDTGNGGVDLDGDPRVLGSAPDMGMDELVPNKDISASWR